MCTYKNNIIHAEIALKRDIIHSKSVVCLILHCTQQENDVMELYSYSSSIQ